jgi:hypothetical protein
MRVIVPEPLPTGVVIAPRFCGIGAGRQTGDEIACRDTAVADYITPTGPDEDLFAFHSEADAPQDAPSPMRTSVPVPPPAKSDVDALLDAVSASGRPTSNVSLPSLYPPPQVREAGLLRRATPFVVRWVAPSAAAFLVGVLGVVFSLPGSVSVPPDRASENPPREDPRMDARAAHVDAASAPVAASEPRPEPTTGIAQLPTPPIFSGLKAVALESLPRVAVQRLVPPAILSAPPRRETARLVTSSPAPERTIARHERRPPSTPSRIVTPMAPSPAISAAPLAPLTTNTARVRDLAPPALVESLRPAHLTSTTPVAATAAEEYGVRRAILSYETAYEDLNVEAAVEVWPTVDRDRLSRAFARLKSQGLEFQSCAITVENASATAYCRGTLEYVRKVGNPTPLLAEQQWMFKMRRAGTGWKIDEVSASQAPILAAQRIRGQG